MVKSSEKSSADICKNKQDMREAIPAFFVALESFCVEKQIIIYNNKQHNNPMYTQACKYMNQVTTLAISNWCK